MKTYSVCFLVMLCLGFTSISAQDTPALTPPQDIQLTSKDSIVSRSWMVGLGVNIVDDSGDMFKELLSAGDQWNYVLYPSRINIGKYFESGLGIEAIGTYNKYKVGKIIDNTVNDTESTYLGFDTRLSYDLNKLIGEIAWFDPYVGVGIGYTDANNQSRGTYNGVIGFRTWFSDRIALDLNSSGKWSMGNEASNHLQHAAALVYQFNIKKKLSKKGQEKLALLQNLEKENQRVQDSIAAAQEAEERAKELADELAREKEATRLEAEKNARLEAENSRKIKIEQDIKNLGKIYFALNSSYLNEASKKVLDKLVEFMNENMDVSLNITSHTDSRGTNKYNNWLSKRRAERTVDYLLNEGISSGRLKAEGLGEEKLANHCKDEVPCTEEEHRMNRRSEFIIINF